MMSRQPSPDWGNRPSATDGRTTWEPASAHGLLTWRGGSPSSPAAAASSSSTGRHWPSRSKRAISWRTFRASDGSSDGSRPCRSTKGCSAPWRSLARVPILIGTEVNIYENKRGRHAMAERLLMAGTDRVVVSAESVRDFYIRQVHADPAKVEVIYNAVDWSTLHTTMTRESLRASLGIASDAPGAGISARR